MYGNISQPSRIYRYGAKDPRSDKVNEQMWLAHRYKNALVAQELERRKLVDETLRKLSPDLSATETTLTENEQHLNAIITKVRSENAKARNRSVTDIVAGEIKRLRAIRSDLRTKRKELRMSLFGSEAWEKRQIEIDEWDLAEKKRLRSESCLYWGSYLHVETSMGNARRGAPPRFHRWDGNGHLAVQIQGGMSVADAFAGSDSRIHIEPVPNEAFLPGGRRLRRTNLSFRVGSEKNGAPIFTTVSFVLHRLIPQDASIKWVHLMRRRIATHCEWSVQFILSREIGWEKQDRATEGAVGIDVGWRVKSDRSLRVAVYVGTDGTRGELTLPADWLSEMRRTEHMQSVRDDNFNVIRSTVSGYLTHCHEKGTILPEWLIEATKTLTQWKAIAKLAALVLRWRDSRFVGDAEIYNALEAWRKRDKHLYEYSANLRDQLQRRREDTYRNFAANMRRTYKTAYIEELDLRDFHKLPSAEEPSIDGALKEHVRDACLSDLMRCLKESMANTEELPAVNTTRMHVCGSMQDFDRKQITHICTSCGVEYDQDFNAAENLLNAGASTTMTKGA